MTDPVRSDLMRRIRGRDTDPELALRKALWRQGLRYRLQYKTPSGRPDLTFVGARVAVYVDGCFWHGCPDHYVAPRSSVGFWHKKLRDNVDRDRRQTLALELENWTVLRFWEHEIYTDIDRVVEVIRRAVIGGDPVGLPQWRVVSIVAVDPEHDLEERRLEALRDPSTVRVVTRRRSTEKW